MSLFSGLRPSHYVTRASVALVFVLALLAITSPARAAEELTLTIEVNADSPGGASIIGVMTADLVRTGDESFTGRWEFTGTLNGSPASSSGALEGSGDANSVSLRATEIHSWDMSGFNQPSSLPAVSVRKVGNLAYITVNGGVSFPFAVQGAVGNPFITGDTHFRVSDPGSGSDNVTELPNTGAGGGRSQLPASALAALLIGGTLAVRSTRAAR